METASLETVTKREEGLVLEARCLAVLAAVVVRLGWAKARLVQQRCLPMSEKGLEQVVCLACQLELEALQAPNEHAGVAQAKTQE